MSSASFPVIGVCLIRGNAVVSLIEHNPAVEFKQASAVNVLPAVFDKLMGIAAWVKFLSMANDSRPGRSPQPWLRRL